MVTRHEVVADAVGAIDDGAVRVSTMTETAMLAKATTAIASRSASSVKYSPKIQALRTMLTIGSTMTSRVIDRIAWRTHMRRSTRTKLQSDCQRLKRLQPAVGGARLRILSTVPS